MANALTGDFDAVLQVSGATVNRLLASLHQNSLTAPELPSVPHSVRLRLGDDGSVDGVRGLVHAQVGVPRLELLHGVTDRFRLELGVRAWYRADPGTTPLPAFIHGTVSAEYRMQDIDPRCFGWSRHAADHLWFRVVQDSVRFTGTAEEDEPGFAPSLGGGGAAGAGQAAQLALIRRQLATLLATRFEATPHQVSAQFRRGAMLSLSPPTGGSAVVLPLPVGGSSSGPITSIERVLLAGSDLAVGVSLDFLLLKAQPSLDALAKVAPTVPVRCPLDTPYGEVELDTVYRASLSSPPTLTWKPQGASGVFELKASGWARTDSLLPDASFELLQEVKLEFDGGAEKVVVGPGSHTIQISAKGLGSGLVVDEVKKALLAEVEDKVKDACELVQTELNALCSRTGDLETQLQSLDKGAAAWLESAEFLPEGMVLRGRIALAARKALVVQSEPTADENGYTALQSWIPGGRIDSFEWSWSWAGTAPPGKATLKDRFLLRRPPGLLGRYGLTVAQRSPLPGLDGSGSLCLRIKGVRVDSGTGQLVPVQSLLRCKRFGVLLPQQAEVRGRLLQRDVPELSQDVPHPQLARVWRASAPRAGPGANTLLLCVDADAGRAPLETTLQALEQCGRSDAALSLLLLFREGTLAQADRQLLAHAQERASGLGLPLLVNEDVQGSWTRAFALPTGTGVAAWRLLGTDGAVRWSHEGTLEAARLARELDTRLVRSRGPAVTELRSGPEVGTQVEAAALHPEWGAPRVTDCPPPPTGRAGSGEAVVAFVQKGAAGMEAQLRELFAAPRGEVRGHKRLRVLVVDGAQADEAQALQRALGLELVALPDPTGALAEHLGVRVWPTALRLDRSGRVSRVHSGALGSEEEAAEARHKEHAEPASSPSEPD